jgi:hypothetical protein
MQYVKISGNLLSQFNTNLINQKHLVKQKKLVVQLITDALLIQKANTRVGRCSLYKNDLIFLSHTTRQSLIDLTLGIEHYTLI